MIIALQASDMKASMINALAFKVYQLEKVNSNGILSLVQKLKPINIFGQQSELL